MGERKLNSEELMSVAGGEGENQHRRFLFNKGDRVMIVNEPELGVGVVTRRYQKEHHNEYDVEFSDKTRRLLEMNLMSATSA